ncbi:palmitoyl-protein thioesterase ABHD10, mitochondrial-like [Oscarella lobularis]|uniref:palmitoyl-protein thioesterase ABHD10, mitochondrial-like n=1 Tax=Oscarella lobularis TaxID=121494 RepID=UPI00331429AB
MKRFVQRLASASGNTIAYEQFSGAKRPGIVFIPGFKSIMYGKKGEALRDYCVRNDRQYTRFDYSGVGISDGKFVDGCLSVWLKDTLSIVDSVTDGKQILVGSSMGGHLASLVCLRRPHRLHALLGIATAADSVCEMKKTLSEKQRNAIERDGYLQMESHYSDDPYVYTKLFFDDAMKEENRLTLTESLDISCPVTLIHGKLDYDVKWQRTQILAQKLKKCTDMKVVYVPDGDHRLSRKQDLELIFSLLDELVN